MEFEDMEVRIYKALAHPIRLKIMKKLIWQSMCVCEMNEDVDFSQSNLSQHLKVLRDAGIVYCEKEGLRINYYIKDPRIIEILKSVENLMIRQIKELNERLENRS